MRPGFGSTALAVMVLVSLVGCGKDDPAKPVPPFVGPPNSIAVAFDELARQTTLEVDLGELFTVYVFVFDVDHDVTSSRFGLPALAQEDVIEVLQKRVYPEGVGTDGAAPLAAEYLLDHGECLDGKGAVPLLQLTLRLLQPVADLELAVGPSQFIPDVDCPANPSLECCHPELHPLGGGHCLTAVPGRTAVINPTR